MAQSTTEADVSDHLEANGISVTSVIKLKPTQKWQEKSSAFKVMISNVNKDDIMNPDLWPDHIEVRDWFFKPKQ